MVALPAVDVLRKVVLAPLPIWAMAAFPALLELLKMRLPLAGTLSDCVLGRH